MDPRERINERPLSSVSQFERWTVTPRWGERRDCGLARGCRQRRLGLPNRVNCRDPALGRQGQRCPSKPTLRPALFQWFPQCNKRHPPTSSYEGARDLAREIAKTEAHRTSRRQRKKVQMLFGARSLTAREPRQRLSGVLRVLATTRRSNPFVLRDAARAAAFGFPQYQFWGQSGDKS